MQCADAGTVVVMSLGSDADESKQVDEAVREEAATDIMDHGGDSLSYKRRSLRGKPRIPTAVDTSRLNKHLTNIWSSKRKRTSKKSEVCSNHLQIDTAVDKSTPFNSEASTVIIVKTLPHKEVESSDSQEKVKKLSEGGTGDRGSRDIAERLKAKQKRFSDMSSSEQAVTCELCAEVVDDYVQLVQHVCQQHDDCTYVRSYLDEIQPIADSLSSVSLPCSVCGRSFTGQVALATHQRQCNAASQVSKLGAHRKRVTAKLLSPSEHTRSRQKPAAVKDGRPCVHCKRRFSSQDSLNKHMARVHKQKAVSSESRVKPVQLSPAGGSQFQRCDHCSACFSRTSLLITHMRYCLKADNN